MTRTEARETAFFIVFEHSFSGESAEDIISKSTEARDLKVPEFSRRLAEGTIREKGEIDGRISKLSKGWNINRISRVSLAILRVAAYEMLFDSDIPVSVSINEAVNLCKVYAGEDDYIFVNGILGSLAREIEEERASGAGSADGALVKDE